MRISVRLEHNCPEDLLWNALVGSDPPTRHGPLGFSLVRLGVDGNSRIVELGVKGVVSGSCRAWVLGDALVVNCSIEGALARLAATRIREALVEWLGALVAKCR